MGHLCAYWLDRLARKVVPLNELFGWCQKNGKTLASVSESIDLSHWVGRLVANVIAGVAEGELEAVQERTLGSHKKLRELGRWHGGTVPYGYKAVPADDGGWNFAVDEGNAPRVRWIVEQALQHRSIRSIADELSDLGIPGRRGGQWTPQTVTRMLRSRWIIGQAEHRGKVVVGSEGLPLQRAEALISYQQWKELQTLLDGRTRPKTRSNGTGLLLNVATCMECGFPLYHTVMAQPERNFTYRYWRCNGKAKKFSDCQAAFIPAHQLEEYVEENVLVKIGHLERQERVYVEAESYEDELDQIEEAISTVREEKDIGLYEGDHQNYLARLSALVERRKYLQSLPTRKAGFEWRGLGETYRQAWQRMGTAERRSLLLDSGITVKAKPLHFHMHFPEDLLEQRFPGYDAEKFNQQQAAEQAEARRSVGLD